MFHDSTFLVYSKFRAATQTMRGTSVSRHIELHILIGLYSSHNTYINLWVSVFQIAVPHRRSFCRAYDSCKHHVRQEERRRVESQYPFSARLYSAMFSKVIFWGERRRHCLRKKRYDFFRQWSSSAKGRTQWLWAALPSAHGPLWTPWTASLPPFSPGPEFQVLSSDPQLLQTTALRHQDPPTKKNDASGSRIPHSIS
jgi:hypothetical protein